MNDIAAGLAEVRTQVELAATRAGRQAADVTLIAVSKFQPVERVAAAVAAGHVDFGENYPQSLRDRVAALGGSPLRWHAIGPLQRNKASIVAELADLFHALDRVEVAEALGRHRVALGRPPLPCLVEVNVGGEVTKAGIPPEELGAFMGRVAGVVGVEVVGLMAMPPMAEDTEMMRPYFRALRELAATHGLGELSMGTTDDYPVAIEEGATMVRVGRAIFGERPARP